MNETTSFKAALSITLALIKSLNERCQHALDELRDYQIVEEKDLTAEVTINGEGVCVVIIHAMELDSLVDREWIQNSVMQSLADIQVTPQYITFSQKSPSTIDAIFEEPY